MAKQKLARRSAAKKRTARTEQSRTKQTSGVALTVLQSPQIERFPVEVQGVLPDGGVAGVDLILARASGPLIDSIGGVPAGASGSPVYVEDRLVGAISTQFFPDFKLVGLTPIEAMRAIATEPPLQSLAAFRRKGIVPSAKIHVGQGGGFLLPVANGFRSKRALTESEKRLGQNFLATPCGTMSVQSGLVPQPGSAIGVGLIVGDIRLGLIGTATAVDGDMLLGLGHPAFFLGPTQLPLTNAIILDVARGTEFPSKVGYLNEVIGTVVQDRAAGIAARLGTLPTLIELNSMIFDKDRMKTERLQTRLAPIPSFIPSLTFISVLEGFQRAMNRVGQGTARWEWAVTVESATEPIRETGVTYSSFDIGFEVALSGEALLFRLIEEGIRVQSISLTAKVEMANTASA